MSINQSVNPVFPKVTSLSQSHSVFPESQSTHKVNEEMKVVNIAEAMMKLQFKLPQTLISQGFTRRTVLHALAFQEKGTNRLMDIYQIWKPKL